MKTRSSSLLAIVGLLTVARAASAQTPFESGGDDGRSPSATSATSAAPEPSPAVPTLAAAPNERPQVKKPASIVGLRVDGAYAQRKLVSLPVTGADMGLAIGAQPTRSFAVWGASRLFLGSTANGLDVFSFRLGADMEGVLFDRLRIGGGVHFFVVGVDRAARDETILSWGPSGSLTARVDLIQSEGYAIFARAALDGGYEVYDGSAFWGPALGAGVDFDLAGNRAALK